MQLVGTRLNCPICGKTLDQTERDKSLQNKDRGRLLFMKRDRNFQGICNNCLADYLLLRFDNNAAAIKSFIGARVKERIVDNL